MKLTKRAVSKSEGAQSANYLTVKPGESVTGVFKGEVFEFWQIWPKDGQKQIFNEPTPGASSRFKANFVTTDGKQVVAKVWEFGVTVYNMLAEIGENFDIENTKVKISRKGSGKETEWFLMPLGALDDKGRAAVDIPLNVLGAAATEHSQEKPETPF